MKKINIGLIGFGTVGQGVLKILQKERSYFRSNHDVDFEIVKLCDRSIDQKDSRGLAADVLTKNIDDVLKDDSIDVVIELIGGMNPAKRIVTEALSKGKHVITANKELIANHGLELFKLAQANGKHLYFESAVMAGIPIIKTISEGVVGNDFVGLYGIINGTCNFILSEMTKNKLTFEDALKQAQEKGYAESDPTLDINGMDSTHKLGILIYLAFGKYIPVKEIYTEGITHISEADIEHAESLGLCIKLLGIAKKEDGKVEARVHPTLISKEHPLGAINGVLNAAYLRTKPLGDVMLSGQGAGQMAAASGVISDLVNLAHAGDGTTLSCNFAEDDEKMSVRSIDDIETKYYLRFNAPDKAGTLAKIAGVLGNHGISINSITQKAHDYQSAVPIIMLTGVTLERSLRTALNEIYSSGMVRTKPVAIRMEKLW